MSVSLEQIADAKRAVIEASGERGPYTVVLTRGDADSLGILETDSRVELEGVTIIVADGQPMFAPERRRQS